MSIQHSQYIVSWIYYPTLRQSWSNVVLTLWHKRGFKVLYYVCDFTASLQRCHNVKGCLQIKFLHEDVKKRFQQIYQQRNKIGTFYINKFMETLSPSDCLLKCGFKVIFFQCLSPNWFFHEIFKKIKCFNAVKYRRIWFVVSLLGSKKFKWKDMRISIRIFVIFCTLS